MVMEEMDGFLKSVKQVVLWVMVGVYMFYFFLLLYVFVSVVLYQGNCVIYVVFVEVVDIVLSNFECGLRWLWKNRGVCIVSVNWRLK